MARYFNNGLVGILAVLIAVAGLASSARAAIIGVDVDIQGDINTYSGAAAIGSPGDVWNSLATNGSDPSFTASSLEQADGEVTPVSVTISSTTGSPLAVLDTDADGSHPDDGNLMRDTIRGYNSFR